MMERDEIIHYKAPLEIELMAPPSPSDGIR
jgi:hypothetical protein